MASNSLDLVQVVYELKCQHAELDKALYYKYLSNVYGGVGALIKDSGKIIDEIIFIEKKMMENSIPENIFSISTPVELIYRYSQLSQFLAEVSYRDSKSFEIAKPLRKIMVSLYNSDYLNQSQKNQLSRILSESELDFIFAGGNHNVASIRMASLIKR